VKLERRSLRLGKFRALLPNGDAKVRIFIDLGGLSSHNPGLSHISTSTIMSHSKNNP
jgi:hypothetical protein